MKKVAKKTFIKKVQKSKSVKSVKRDQYTVVLEDLNSQFKVFGEALQLTNEKMDRGFAEMREEFRNEFNGIKTQLASIENRLAEHDTRLAQLELAIQELIKEMRDDTKEKEIEALKIRVAKLEALIEKK
jgi:chromosome segregation ATPase